jgi:hypothetical protein
MKALQAGIGIKPKPIYIKYADDFDYFDIGKSVTVQRFEQIIEDDDAVLVYCNHAGATEEDYENEIYYPEGPSQTYIATQLVCDKCEAYRYLGENYWHEAPEEGAHRDD